MKTRTNPVTNQPDENMPVCNPALRSRLCSQKWPAWTTSTWTAKKRRNILRDPLDQNPSKVELPQVASHQSACLASPLHRSYKHCAKQRKLSRQKIVACKLKLNIFSP